MIQQAQDVYTWDACYTDGSFIAEDDREEGRAFSEVDKGRVQALRLFHCKAGPSHRVDVPRGAQPVFFRRRSITIDPLQGESSPRPTVHCIGWKRGEEAVYLFVLDDGSTLLTDNLQAV
jgi:hypothetical protein